MNALRASSTLARLVLAWFVLALGVAVAAPLVQPTSVEVVCSAGGAMKIVVIDDDGNAVQMAQGSLDCPMCLPAAPTPSTNHARANHALPREPKAPFVAATRVTTTAGAPLPPRGPPSFS